MEGVPAGRAESVSPCCLLLGRASTGLSCSYPGCIWKRFILGWRRSASQISNISAGKTSRHYCSAHLFPSCVQALQPISLCGPQVWCSIIARSFFPFRSRNDTKCVGSHDPAFKVVSLWLCLKSLLSLELPFPAAAGCELLPLTQSHPQGLEATELAD